MVSFKTPILETLSAISRFVSVSFSHYLASMEYVVGNWDLLSILAFGHGNNTWKINPYFWVGHGNTCCSKPLFWGEALLTAFGVD